VTKGELIEAVWDGWVASCCRRQWPLRPTGRPTEAPAVLAPAVEGFSPTPEMPEIAEAQVLLQRLA
jgi:hypothetical protein